MGFLKYTAALATFSFSFFFGCLCVVAPTREMLIETFKDGKKHKSVVTRNLAESDTESVHIATNHSPCRRSSRRLLLLNHWGETTPPTLRPKRRSLQWPNTRAHFPQRAHLGRSQQPVGLTTLPLEKVVFLSARKFAHRIKQL